LQKIPRGKRKEQYEKKNKKEKGGKNWEMQQTAKGQTTTLWPLQRKGRPRTKKKKIKQKLKAIREKD